jgi:hypothetical protein
MEHKSGYGHHLVLVHEIEHPDGRKRNHELDADRPGSASSGGAGSSKPIEPVFCAICFATGKTAGSSSI